MSSQTEIRLLDLDVVPYGQALALQYELRDRLIAGDVPERTAGYLIFLEHEPVVTLGKRGVPDHLVQRERLHSDGVEIFEIDRGGEATFHGPGQLVVYPIVELERLAMGVVDVVRGLAATIADAFAEFGVEADYDTDHPGVWTTDEQPHRKLASVGMRVKRGVSTHGAAINLVNDMRPFSLIVPCGMPDAPMARLADYTDDTEAITPTAFRRRLAPGIEALTGAELTEADVPLPERSDWITPSDL